MRFITIFHKIIIQDNESFFHGSFRPAGGYA